MRFRSLASSLRKPSAVLFDWDDTLFKHSAFADALAETLVQKLFPGSTAAGAEINQLWHKSAQTACETYFPGYTQEQVLEQWDKLYVEVPKHNFAMLDHAKEVLESLRTKKIPVGIVSNKSRDLIMYELELLGLSDHFDVVVGKHKDRTKRKPNPDPIVVALDTLKVPLEDVWYIGDTMDDMHAARSDSIQRFHIHASDDRREMVRAQADANDPAGSVISLSSLEEFHKHFVMPIRDNMPTAGRVLL